MRLHTLPKSTGEQKKKRRAGRGIGSSKGKTSGHGVKGQRVRNRLKLSRLQIFTGFPFLRGKKERGSHSETRPYTVKLYECEGFLADEVVTPELLYAKGLVPKAGRTVKILGNGTIRTPLTFSNTLLFTRSAEKKIASAGGTITQINT